MDDIRIERQESGDSGEYHAFASGSDAVSRLTWVQRGEVRHAEHTLVPDELRGHGIAAKLVDALVADAREQGFTISPDCSYVAAQFRRHPEWSELLA